MEMYSVSSIQNSMKEKSVSVIDIVNIALMVALIEVGKTVLAFLPNIELTTFFIIMFMLFYGKKTCLVIPVFILLEGCLYGFGLWWVMYLYAWPLLAFITWLFRKQNSALFWSVVSSVFGLSFGYLCSIPYFFYRAIKWWTKIRIYNTVYLVGCGDSLGYSPWNWKFHYYVCTL